MVLVKKQLTIAERQQRKQDSFLKGDIGHVHHELLTKPKIVTGLQWISARWGHAQSMCIEMDNKAMVDFLAALLHEDGGTDRPQELLQLQMVCEDTETDADSQETIGRLLAHLAHRAEGLRLLCLTSSKLPTLPQLPSLKHLILDQGSMPITAIARSLLELTALKTLFIKCDTEDEDKSCAAYADRPELALALFATCAM